MPDREKVIDALRNCTTAPKCRDCPWEDCERVGHKKSEVPVTLLLDVLELLREQEAVAARQDKIMHSWRTIKLSAVDTANNNAGPDGNLDVYMILTWVATMMDQQEAKWND